MLKKLLNEQIRIRLTKNLVQGKSFREMLEKAIKRYTNKSIDTAQVIEELIELAKKMKQAEQRPEHMKLSEAEVAFYDALAENDSAIKVLGEDTLKKISVEIADTIRKNVKIDWTLKESIQAGLRVMVKRILKKYGYPPDKQAAATELVLEQANLSCKDWAENGHKQTA